MTFTLGRSLEEFIIGDKKKKKKKKITLGSKLPDGQKDKEVVGD